MGRTLIGIAFVLILLTSGCLGINDEGQVDEDNLTEWETHYVDSIAELPDCDEASLGRLYYISIEAEFRACTDDGWTAVSLLGPKGEDGADGQDGADGSNGADGQDGADGSNGADGQDGADGSNGADGFVSPNTLLTHVSNPMSLSECHVGGLTISYGLDNGDGVGITQNGILEEGEYDIITTHCSRYGFGVSKVADIWKGPLSSIDEYSFVLGSIGDTAFFRANNGVTGDELWAYNSSNGTVWQASDIASPVGWSPGAVFSIQVGDTIFFDADDGITGRELWAHSSSNNTSWLVHDINQGEECYNSDGEVYCDGLGSHPKGAILVGDTIFFLANDNSSGIQLWAHKPGNSSTWEVHNLMIPPVWSSCTSLTEIDGIILFPSFEGVSSVLMAHDTSNSSTYIAAFVNLPYCGLSIAVGDTLLFDAFGYDPDGDGDENSVFEPALYAYDTSNSTYWISADTYPGQTDMYGDRGLLVGQDVYFVSRSSDADWGLFYHDLYSGLTTQVPTGQVNEIPGENLMLEVRGTLYFSNTVMGDSEVWAYNSTNHTSWNVTSGDGESGIDPHNGIVVGDTIFFSGEHIVYGYEMWALDTKNGNYWQITDIHSDDSSYPQGFHHVGGKIIFMATDGFGGAGTGFELWELDLEMIQAY